MICIDVDNIKPGQIFTHPVYIESDTIFIPAGVPVREKDPQRLCSCKVEQLETEGAVSLANNLRRAFLNTWGLPADDDLLRFYISIIERVDDIFVRIRAYVRVKPQDIENIVSLLIETVEKRGIKAVQLVLTNIADLKSYAKMAVNTVLLALTVGLSLNRTRRKLHQLCTAALLHDVGMHRVPPEIIEQNRSLNEQELKTLRTHPLYSYRIIGRELQIPAEVAQIALQHHERWDGGGYPQQLSGTEITFDARIVSVADAFKAMVCERPWRNSMTGYEAMRSILSNNQRRFDPEIVKILIRAMGLYPPGSLVMLSDGSVGRVISSSQDVPLRPEVIILINSIGREYRGTTCPVVDLLNDRNLFITRGLDIRGLIEKNRS